MKHASLASLDFGRLLPPDDGIRPFARSKAGATAAKRLDVEARARAIAAVAPFTAWPLDAVRRVAEASRVRAYRRGDNIVSRGDRPDAVFLVVEGNASVGLTAATGRSVVFTIHPPRERIHGIATLVDGGAMPHDVTADDRALVLAIPIAAVRSELARAPALWESVAREVTVRARAFVEEARSLLLEPLRPRLASLLLALAASSGLRTESGSVVIALRVPQERLGEMLGVSRQTATALVGDLVRDGLVQWRYGRVTLLDPARLQLVHAAAEPGHDRPNPPPKGEPT